MMVLCLKMIPIMLLPLKFYEILGRRGLLMGTLPFSDDSYSGSNVLIKGIDSVDYSSIPLHNVYLASKLFSGPVKVMVVSTITVLSAPSFDRPFELAVDASDVAVGAVLLQEDSDGIDHPVCSFSPQVGPESTQLLYSTTEKEIQCLALILHCISAAF